MPDDVRHHRGSSSTRQSDSSALINREDELRALHYASDTASLVLVEGEAGVGKTSLVNGFALTRARKNARTYTGHCRRRREPLPFLPLIEIFRAARDDLPEVDSLSPVAGALNPIMPELGERLPTPPLSLGDPSADRYRIFRGALELLSRLTPATVIFEDLHWADGNTTDFLRFLVPQLPDRLSVIITYRAEDMAAPIATLLQQLRPDAFRAHLVLTPLAEPGVAQLLSQLFAAPVPDALSRLIHQRTGGLPFAVEEVARSLLERHLATGQQPSYDEILRLAVPTALREAILERVGRVSPDAQLIARASAVLGVPSSERVLDATAGLGSDRTTPALSALLAAALLTETAPDTYDFRHPLAAKTVYESIPPSWRRELHRRAAAVLREQYGSDALAQIARHFRHAGDTGAWLTNGEEAADRLLARGDDEAACRLLVDILSGETIAPEMRVRLALKLADAALNRLVDPDAARVLARVLEEDSVPDDARGNLHFRLAALLYNQGDHAVQAREQLIRALPYVQNEVLLATRTRVHLAIPFAGLEPAHEHLRWLDSALVGARDAADPELVKYVRAQSAPILMSLGDARWREALREVDQGPPPGPRARDVGMAYVNLALVGAYLGHYAAAEAFAARTRELCPDEHDASVTVPLESTQLVLDWGTGRWDGLEERARAFLRRGPAVRTDQVDAELVLAMLLVARRELAEADSYFDRASASALLSGGYPSFALGCGGRARAALVRNDVHSALLHTSQALDVLRRKQVWAWGADLVPVAVEALLRRTDVAAARRVVEEFAAGLEGRDAPAALAAADVARGLLCESESDVPSAVFSFEAAERAWTEIGRPYDAACAAEARGRVLAARDPSAAVPALHSALDTFNSLGAELDYSRARMLLRSHRLRVPSRAGRRSYGVLLSPREAEVAELAASGRTNQQIAEQLVLSRHTIAKHLMHAMQKLRVRSRDELPEALRATRPQ